MKSGEEKDEVTKKVLAKRGYESYPEYMTRILEPDSNEAPEHRQERLDWIKKNLPTVAQSDYFKKFVDSKDLAKKEFPILDSMRHKAVQKLADEGKPLKEAPVISKRSRVILTSQVSARVDLLFKL